MNYPSQETTKNWSLEQREAESRKIIKEAIEKHQGKIATAWSGGKDSTTVLHLIKQEFGKVIIPVVFIDTSVKFPEIYAFRDKLAKEWNLNLIIIKNENALKEIEIAKDKKECCYLLKTLPLRQIIEKNGWQALITAVRWDEQEARKNEVYISPRENPPHLRIHPILHFREIDIWSYIKKYNVPYCELYHKGYRSLGCIPCTQLGSAEGPERSGRDQSKEEIMQRLRDLGYF
ncbi:MAG: Phosphoadenosine phosphosulfate reductase [Candidatus Methanoperedenaceae archaeon GB50]|nr:Phosphoadenosine phosphosulfate reductase [Candidatus Methanoperedenaceae archaeon GB50]CAD7772698.1 MAG: Phosphoadenosine phosphosulfate reductase [Candidatus Methanoperedenaceae archaeon GB50]